MMRYAGLILFMAIGGLLVYMLSRPATPTPVFAGLFGNVTDQAVPVDITTGSNWYDYWRNVLSGVYTRVGIMPPEGPLVACIVAPCVGTPIPQSP